MNFLEVFFSSIQATQLNANDIVFNNPIPDDKIFFFDSGTLNLNLCLQAQDSAYSKRKKQHSFPQI